MTKISVACSVKRQKSTAVSDIQLQETAKSLTVEVISCMASRHPQLLYNYYIPTQLHQVNTTT